METEVTLKLDGVKSYSISETTHSSNLKEDNPFKITQLTIVMETKPNLPLIEKLFDDMLVGQEFKLKTISKDKEFNKTYKKAIVSSFNYANEELINIKFQCNE